MQDATDYTIALNTTLIIPEGITLTKNNAKLIFDCSNSSSTSNIFVFGTLLGNHENSSVTLNSAIDIGITKTDSGYVCVIIGPNGRYVKNSNKPPIYAYCKNVNFLLYPECELKTENRSNIFGNDMIAGEGGNLYLNRFTKVNKLLSGEAEKSINVIYPNIPAEYDFEQKDSGNSFSQKVYYSYTKFFPYFYWTGTLNTHTPVPKLDPESPIEFVSNTLQLSSSNFAKYDVKLWDQCKVERGIYSFKEFVNINKNKDKLINIDTLEDLFMDGKSYQPKDSTQTGLLNNMPDVINIGMTGTKNITIYTDGN